MYSALRPRERLRSIMLGSLINRFTSSKGGDATPPERRRVQRLPATDGKVEIDGESCPLVNWSYTGFLAEAYGGDHKAGDKVGITISVAFGEGRFEFECPAVLVRVDQESRKVVGAFAEMDTATRIEIARHFG